MFSLEYIGSESSSSFASTSIPSEGNPAEGAIQEIQSADIVTLRENIIVSDDEQVQISEEIGVVIGKHADFLFIIDINVDLLFSLQKKLFEFFTNEVTVLSEKTNNYNICKHSGIIVLYDQFLT